MVDKKVFKNLIHADFKRALGISFLMSVVLVVLCLAFDSWGDLNFIITSPKKIDVCYYYFNSISFGGTYSGYLLPMLAALPFAASYCVEEQSHMITFIVARADKRKYCLSKIVVSAVSGGLALALGSFLFILLLSFRIPLVTEGKLAEMTMGKFPYYDLLAVGNGGWYFVVVIYLAFLRGFLCAAAAVAISSYFTNKYVTIVSPFILTFLLARAYNFLHISSNFRLDFWLKERAGFDSNSTNILTTTAVVLIITAICGNAFMRRVRRRIEYGSHS